MKTFAIIDVRPHDEWSAGYIQDAVNVELETFISTFGLLLNDGSALTSLVPDKNTKLVVYGSGDDRAWQFAAKARQIGYSDVNYYRDGIADWKSRGDYLVMAYDGFKVWHDAACPFNDEENYLIDVNSHRMYVDFGHIPGAVNVVSDYFIKFGITNEGEELTEVVTNMDAKLVVYCINNI
jgi:rhodanese-related sulfurtransferase